MGQGFSQRRKEVADIKTSSKIAVFATLALSITALIANCVILTVENEALKVLLSEAQGVAAERAIESPVGGSEIEIEQNVIHPDDFIKYSSPYGLRYSPFTSEIVYHPGLDLYGVWHSRIVAPCSGTIIEHWVPPGQSPGFVGHEILGGMLKIQLDTGEILVLGHLSTTFVHEGDRFEKGDVIARQGSTGISTGEHLHLEVYVDGVSINPLSWFASYGTAN